MKSVAAVLVCLEYAALAAAGANAVPRGVGPEFVQFYQDTESFACISNPSLRIAATRVNDDYCDCPDGSDEPGTAACAHLSPLSPHSLVETIHNPGDTSVALPGFYCENKGHLPSYVPFSHVNDGVCDYELCCDGSEEWDHVGGLTCKNRCDEIGKEWRKHDAARRKSAETASRKRRELVEEAARLRRAVADRITTLTADVAAAETQVQKLEQELADAQRRDLGRTSSSKPKESKLGKLVGLARERTEALRSSLLSAVAQRDASKSRLDQLEAILTAFKDEYNPNFNDEGVKRAVRAWEDYVAARTPESDESAASVLEALSKTDKDFGLDWEQYEDEGEASGVLFEFENLLPASVRNWLDPQLRSLRTTLIENGILADTSSGDGESKATTTARTRLSTAQKDLETHRTSLRDAQTDLGQDFGPDDVFRALKGQCVETDAGEYTYQVCFLDKTYQKSKKGGSHTNMGSYVRLELVEVDEPLASDGKGLGSGTRIAMKHENGQHCWNGPNRSTTVILACAEQNEVWKILEEEKCVYRMEVGTPAVCDVPVEKVVKSAGHDEL